jgi:hypothetical protein
VRTRSRARGRIAAVVLMALLAFAGSITPASAWSNRGDGYGTHDWILDQAFRLLKARGIGYDWVNRTIALEATDDPDTVEKAADPGRKIEHVYTGAGLRGGAIHRITEHYAKILRLYGAQKYNRASYHLGMLAHFWGDLSMPYHTERSAKEFPDEHHAYELLVNDLTRKRIDMPAWSVANTSWVVSTMPNVRSAAIALAAFSRAQYWTVHDNLEPADASLNEAVQAATGEVLIRASGDLANLILSVPDGVGIPPPVGSLELWVRWHGVKADETDQMVYGRVRDIDGQLVEGVEVDVTFPTATGPKVGRFWTDETGEGRVRIEVGSPTLMAKMKVTGEVKTDKTRVTDADWYYRTEMLADGSTGFWTSVRDRSVAQGQIIIVRTYARTPEGNPIAGLMIDWTWMLPDAPKMTTGYTNDMGEATTSIAITDDTADAQVYVYAHTSAYSLNRKSKTWFLFAD